MSSVGKTVKKLAKVVLTVAAVAVIAFGFASAVGAASGAASGGAAAGTGSAAAAASSTAAMSGGAAATGGGMLSGIGSAIGSMAPMTKSTLLMMGGNMVSGALQPTQAEEYKDMREAQIASIQGTSGMYNNNSGGIGQQQAAPVAQPEEQAKAFEPQSNIGIQAPEIQSAAAPTTSSTVRFDPQAGRFVS